MQNDSGNNRTSRIEEDEISLVMIINRLKDITSFIITKWRLVLFIGLIFAILMGGYYYFKKTEYIANSKIMLEEKTSSSGMSPYFQFASQLGMVPPTALSETKLIELLSTRTIIGNTLLKSAKFSGKEIMLANYLIDSMGFHDKWKNDEELRDIKFENNDLHKLTYSENKALNRLYLFIKDDCLTCEKMESGIISISISTSSEMFSKNYTELIVESLSSFYTNNIIQKEKNDFLIVQNEVDSLEILLRNAEMEYAKWKDESHHIIKYLGNLKESDFQTDIQILRTLYVEAQKNLALAKFNLLYETPIIQIIDFPALPLTSIRYYSYIGFILGGGLGIFLTGIFLFFKKLFKDAYADSKENIPNG